MSVETAMNFSPVIVEVIVIGLGPAGSTAVRLLSDAGVRVAGIDRSDFPRSKTCGGGVSARSIPFLPKGWDALPHTVTTGVSLSYLDYTPVEVDMGRPIAYQFRREEFDLFLVEMAEEAGADLFFGRTVTDLVWNGSLFRLTTDQSEIFESPVLIAADGATSQVYRFLCSSTSEKTLSVKKKKSFHHGFPSSERVSECESPSRRSDVLIDLGSVPGGYGWSFPKSGSVNNIGVVSFTKPLRNPLETLKAFAETVSIKSSPFPEGNKSRTWMIPDFQESKMHGMISGLFFIGDAGGMVDPFLGEGIYYAMLSAKRAISEILTHRGQPERASQSYAEWAVRDIFRDFSQARRLASIIYRFPGIYFRLVQKYPHILSLYSMILCGSHDYRSFSRTIGKNLFNLPFRKFFPRLRSNRLV
ncbi:MAG: NAD(P)/FAD-dependent oxidoreductase [Leptospirales bacterium]